MRAWGRLLRLSLAPSPAADIAAGLVLGSLGVWPSGAHPWLLIAASLFLYHGAMAQNDWADRRADSVSRPGRPIPSAAVPAALALAAGLSLPALGVVFSWAVSLRAGIWTAAIAFVALAYNFAGRGPWIGPLLLGICRAGNLGLGLDQGRRIDNPLMGDGTQGAIEGAMNAAANGAQGLRLPTASAFAVAGLYGTYVFLVSRLSRFEDRPEPDESIGSRPGYYLAGSAAALAALPFVPVGNPISLWSTVPAVLAWCGAAGLVREAHRHRSGALAWTREQVERAMGLALRRLLVFSATAALLARPWSAVSWSVAGAILLGYGASYGLRRVFPPS